MNLLLAMPIELRVAASFLLGAALGTYVNFAIYRFAWTPRQISPLSPPPPGAAARTWGDRLPILGWLRLRREASLHGAGFWIRPMLIELFLGVGLAALYWWEIQEQAIVPSIIPLLEWPPGRHLADLSTNLLHLTLLSHAILIALMTVATFIDIDEKTIPDQITLPGTILALVLATFFPWSLLPGMAFVVAPARTPAIEFLQICSPNAWPDALDVRLGHFAPLVLAIGCLWLWCFALLPRTWHGRYGIVRAMRYFVAKIMREPFSRLVATVGAAGTVGILIVSVVGGNAFRGLLSALVGMVAGTAIIWSVRLVGRAVLKKEAMGFGDVTLMAMIGAFLGWQPCLVVFFLAPLAGLIVGVGQWLLIRDNVIPYGPFLCLAAVTTVVWWAPIWDYLRPLFEAMGHWIPLILVVCLIVMAILLALLQGAKYVVRRLF